MRDVLVLRPARLAAVIGLWAGGMLGALVAIAIDSSDVTLKVATVVVIVIAGAVVGAFVASGTIVLRELDDDT